MTYQLFIRRRQGSIIEYRGNAFADTRECFRRKQIMLCLACRHAYNSESAGVNRDRGSLENFGELRSALAFRSIAADAKTLLISLSLEVRAKDARRKTVPRFARHLTVNASAYQKLPTSSKLRITFERSLGCEAELRASDCCSAEANFRYSPAPNSRRRPHPGKQRIRHCEHPRDRIRSPDPTAAAWISRPIQRRHSPERRPRLDSS